MSNLPDDNTTTTTTTTVAGMMTPVSAATFQNLQLDAGVFLIGVDLTSITTATALRTAAATAMASSSTCLGATRGGGSFVVEAEEREREVDGVRYRFKGSTARDSIDARLTTTLLEVFPGNIQRVLGSADAVAATGTGAARTDITMRTRIANSDYISKLLWVGDLADGRLIGIELYNALNTAGMNMTFTDKGEATMPVEFHAHQASVTDYDTAPFKIYIFDDPAT